MTEIIGIGIAILRAVFGFLLIFFIPGYAAIWALFPEKDQLPLIERIAYSCVTSIGLTMVSVLSLDLIIGVDTTPINIALILILVTLLCGFAGIVFYLLQPLIRIDRITSTIIKSGGTYISRFFQRVKSLIRR